jgi:hypothetical protein
MVWIWILLGNLGMVRGNQDFCESGAIKCGSHSLAGFLNHFYLGRGRNRMLLNM